MTEVTERFIERVNQHERCEAHWLDYWSMPRELMIALRDELKAIHAIQQFINDQKPLEPDVAKIINEDFHKIFEKF